MLKSGKLKAVGFDVDGTLYSIPDVMSIEISREVTQMAARILGRDVDEFAEEYVQKRDHLRSNTMTLNSYGLDGEKIFQGVVDNFPMEKYVSRDEKLIKIIARLKEKYQLFIITNGSAKQVDRKLKLIGLDKNDFNPRIYCYDQGWLKPDPAPFLAALESLELQAAECVYIGDREDIDIESAQAVGMKTIYIRGESKLADSYCDTVYDIVNIL